VSLRSERLVSGVLVGCALIVTGLLIRRELMSEPVGVVASAPEEPIRVENWKALLLAGPQFGTDEANVSIVVFSDFECPFCRSFHQSLQTVRREFGDRLLVTYVHFPLSYHKHAFAAAVASECAAAQGRFEQFADVVFAQQDSLGVLPWSTLAENAEVPSRELFARCLADTVPTARVELGRALAQSIGARGTPTVVLNGWRLAEAPSLDELRELLRNAATGQPPRFTAP
jgi:protein-disulfide isomerase